MRSMLPTVISLASILLFAQTALAGPRTYSLLDDGSAFRSGPGVEVARDNCLSCHSADYVTTQPPKMGASFWEATVLKMVKAYHAPISDDVAKAIVDYLARTY
jgi:sulfite dehydrogenase (cytochrome) subunit B